MKFDLDQCDLSYREKDLLLSIENDLIYFLLKAKIVMIFAMLIILLRLFRDLNSKRKIIDLTA